MYAIVSDLHFHNWTAFASQSDGVNSRLQLQLDGLKQVGAYCANNGIKKLIVAGDVFHVRGSLVPSVLNPVMEAFSDMEDAGITVFAIPGNHDLESKVSDWQKSAITPLESAGVIAYHDPHYNDGIVYVPWISSLPELLITIEKFTRSGINVSETDLILHAPLNGVVKGIPDIGLMPSQLEQFGFRNVFCGHYHNHKQMSQTVWSIGALMHQTWSDVGSKAGFIVVDDDGSVTHQELSAEIPRFVDLDMRDDGFQFAPEACRGNFIRVTLDGSDEELVRTAKEGVSQLGARGALVRVVPPSVTRITRDDDVKNAGSLEAAVSLYIDKTFNNPQLQEYCNDLMRRASGD